MSQDYSSLGLPRNFYEELDIRAFRKLGCDFTCSEEEFLKFIQGKDVPFLLFGVSGKKIAALFAQARSDSWLWASVLSDGNADHVQAMLSLTETIPYMPSLDRLMSTLPFETKLRLLKATTFKYRGEKREVDWELLKDVLDIWEEINEPDVRQFGRIRCWFSLREDLRRMWDEVAVEEPLRQPKELENISGEGWTISVPMTSKKLREYGMELHNCLGVAYVDKINTGRSIVFIVYEDGVATHAVHINRQLGRIQEFFKDRNSPGDERIKAEVAEALWSHGWLRGATLSDLFIPLDDEEEEEEPLEGDEREMLLQALGIEHEPIEPANPEHLEPENQQDEDPF